MNSIFPPVLESRHPSIWYLTGDISQEALEVKFLMPIMNDKKGVLKHLQVCLKYKNTNQYAINLKKEDGGPVSPNRQILFCDTTDNGTAWTYDEPSGMCTVRIPYRFFDGGRPKNGVEYMLQVRFGDAAIPGATPGEWVLNGNGWFAQWYQQCTMAIPSNFGEWSNLEYVYCITQAVSDIRVECLSDFVPTLHWTYSSGNAGTGIFDPIEQVILNYEWDAIDYLGNAQRNYRSMTLTGTQNESDGLVITQKIPIAPVTNIKVSVDAVTTHNSVYHNDFTLVVNKLNNPFVNMIPYTGEFYDTPLGTHEVEDGVISKTFKIRGANAGLTYNVYRYNLGTLECIKLRSGIPLSPNAEVTFKDYSVEMGEQYQYVVAVFKEKAYLNGTTEIVLDGLLGSIFEQGKDSRGYGRLMQMEVSFLDDRYHQLRLHGNVKISNFKRNTSDQFQTTIGDRYPFYIRNGAQNYRSLQVSATISINFDPTFSFLKFRDGIGLSFETPDTGALVIPECDLFTEDEFSHNRWRLGHPNGDVKERAKIEQLGLDARAGIIADGNGNPEIVLELTRQMNNFNHAIDASRYASEPGYADWVRAVQNEYQVQIDAAQGGVKTAWMSQRYMADLNGLSAYSPNLQKNRVSFIGTDHSDENVFMERKFREVVMAWLSDGKPKLYRSETEGNMIVIVSGATFTPTDKTQRMVYDVSFTLTEIAEYNLMNLIEYNLIPIEIESTFSPVNEWEFIEGNPDPWVSDTLGFVYYPMYDIPDTKVGNAISEIDVRPGVINVKGNLSFHSNELPDGIIITDEGVIKGTPEKPSDPYVARIYVTDVRPTGEIQEASMVIRVGRMYNNFQILPTAKTLRGLKVGDPLANLISDSENLTFVVSDTDPGTPPYFWEIENPVDNGIRLEPVAVNGVNGLAVKLVGMCTRPLNNADFNIKVTDATGQVSKAVVVIQDITVPLDYYAKEEWQHLGIYEQGVPVPAVDFSVTVSGGTPPYTFTGTKFPSGLSITPNGKLTGIPSGTAVAGRAEIVVTDAAGASKPISVYFSDIIEQFVFYKPDGIDITGSWVFNQSKTIDIMKSTATVGGTQYSPPVFGGVPRAKPPRYRFQLLSNYSGVLENFSITEDGVLKGLAKQVCQAGYLTIRVYDDRNVYRERTMQTPQVVGDFRYTGPSLSLKEMQVGTTYSNPFFTFSTKDFAAGRGDPARWTASATDLPPGLSIQRDPSNTFTWQCVGQPTGPVSSYTATIQVSDDPQEEGGSQQTSIAVTVNPIWSQLSWIGPITPIPIANAGSNVELQTILPEIVGGKPPFRIDLGGDISPYKLSMSAGIGDADRQYIRIYGTPGVNAKEPRTVSVTVTDANGQKATLNLDIGRINGPFTLGKGRNVPLLTAELSVVPKGVFFSTYPAGGSGSFRFSVEGSTSLEILDTGLFVDPDDGSIYGTPSKPFGQIDLAGMIRVTDLVSGAYQTIPSITLTGASEKARLNPDFPWDSLASATATIKGKSKGDSAATAQALFIAGPGTISSTGSWPTGVSVNSNTYKLQGSFSNVSDNQLTWNITLTIAANDYTPQQKVKCTIIYPKISGDFSYISVPDSLKLPVLEKGVKIDDLEVGNGRSGGVGPYSWRAENLPAGLTLSPHGTNNGLCLIVGTPTTKQDKSFTVYIYCKDEGGTGKPERKISLNCGGIYDPMTVISPDDIPPQDTRNGNTNDITPISLEKTKAGQDIVTGGTGSYTWKEKDPKKLASYGYSINAKRITGRPMSTSMPETTTVLIVKDNTTGIEKEVVLKIGAITGTLGLKQKEIVVPSVGKGAAITVINLPTFLLEGTGDSNKTYEVVGTIPTDWVKNGIYGIELTDEGIIQGRAPNKTVTAKEFQVRITDTDNSTQTITIKLPQIT